MNKQLDRCLAWALQGLSEHEAWGVREEVYNAIRRTSIDEIEKLKIELKRVQTIKRLAEEHIQEHITPYSITMSKYKEANEWSANPYKGYVDATIELLIHDIIQKAGSAEEAGINAQGVTFHPDFDCPKCGGELDVEYKLCDCGWVDDGAGDVLADRRADK